MDGLKSSEPASSIVPARAYGTTDPQGLLAHITAIVSENSNLRNQLEEQGRKVQELTTKLSEMLFKNQR